MKKQCQIFLTIAITIIALACNKQKPQSESTSSPMVKSVTPPEQEVVHKTFSLQKYESFTMEVPPHCMRPRLHGTFKSFRYGDQGNRASDEAANIDVLLLDEQQFSDFSHGPLETPTRSAQNAYEQQIDWALPSSFDNSKKYYLVFNNATGKPKTKMVEADLTLSFD